MKHNFIDLTLIEINDNGEEFFKEHISEMKNLTHLKHIVKNQSIYAYEYLRNLPLSLTTLEIQDLSGINIQQINNSNITTLIIKYLYDFDERFLKLIYEDKDFVCNGGKHNFNNIYFQNITSLTVNRIFCKQAITTMRKVEALLKLFPNLEKLQFIYKLGDKNLDEDIIMLLEENGIELVEKFPTNRDSIKCASKR